MSRGRTTSKQRPDEIKEEFPPVRDAEDIVPDLLDHLVSDAVGAARAAEIEKQSTSFRVRAQPQPRVPALAQ